MKVCRNDTCTQLTRTTFCSRRCQLTTRNLGHRGQLPDIWVGMDTERAIQQRAALLDCTVRDLIVNLIEGEVAHIIGWDRLDFGEGAA